MVSTEFLMHLNEAGPETSKSSVYPVTIVQNIHNDDGGGALLNIYNAMKINKIIRREWDTRAQVA
jgi:hypothetical protein